ncbi:MAG: hypothetical protein ACLR7Z_18475 [Bilophila wadsworthia]
MGGKASLIPCDFGNDVQWLTRYFCVYRCDDRSPVSGWADTRCARGLATQARLCVDMLQQGRGMAWVVKNRDELLTARALMRLSPELSSGDFLPDAFDKAAGRLCRRFLLARPTVRGWTERLSALYALRSGQAKGLLLTADNLLPKLVPLDFFENREVTLIRGEDVSLDMILEQAVEWGYERVSMVSNPGEIARRGDILDIMPPGYDKPIRLDFFGDLIEEIRLFDPVSQRSKANLSEVRVLPVSPIRQSPADQAKMQARWKSLFQKNMLTENERFGLTRLQEQGDFRLLPGCCYDTATNLEAWLPADTVWVLPGLSDFRDMLSSGTSLDGSLRSTGCGGPSSAAAFGHARSKRCGKRLRAVRLCSRRTAGDGHRQRNP